MTENLPLVQDEFPVPSNIDSVNVTLQDVQLMNVRLDHFIFKQLAVAWKKADSIMDIGACMAMTHRAIEKHRDHLLMPNAAQSSSKKESIVYPID